MNEIENSETSSAGSVVLHKYIYPEGKRTVILEPVVTGSETDSSIVMLRDMATRILSGLEELIDLTDARDDPEALVLLNMLRTFVRSKIERTTESKTPVLVSGETRITHDDVVTFGMSESTARRLWENEEDEIWNDL